MVREWLEGENELLRFHLPSHSHNTHRLQRNSGTCQKAVRSHLLGHLDSSLNHPRTLELRKLCSFEMLVIEFMYIFCVLDIYICVCLLHLGVDQFAVTELTYAVQSRKSRNASATWVFLHFIPLRVRMTANSSPGEEPPPPGHFLARSQSDIPEVAPTGTTGTSGVRWHPMAHQLGTF